MKFKELVPTLKVSLAMLMKASAEIFKENSKVDNCQRAGEENMDRFEQCLENFYALCDQIELNLRLGLECAQQNIDNSKNARLPVASSAVKVGDNSEGQTYQQYLSMVQSQVSCAKEIHESLLDCAKKLSEKQMTFAQQQQQQHMLSHQQQMLSHQQQQQQSQ